MREPRYFFRCLIVVLLDPVDNALMIHPQEPTDPPEVSAVKIHLHRVQSYLRRVARRFPDQGVGALTVLTFETRHPAGGSAVLDLMLICPTAGAGRDARHSDKILSQRFIHSPSNESL